MPVDLISLLVTIPYYQEAAYTHPNVVSVDVGRARLTEIREVHSGMSI